MNQSGINGHGTQCGVGGTNNNCASFISVNISCELVSMLAAHRGALRRQKGRHNINLLPHTHTKILGKDSLSILTPILPTSTSVSTTGYPLLI